MKKEKIKERFKNHVATLTVLGNEFPEGSIKILDFQEPGCSNYYIRFLFDERNYTLTISGDLGFLVARNATNMTLKGFKNFLYNPSYFKEKVRCSERPLKEYDEDAAVEDLKQYFEEYELIDEIREKYGFEDDTDEDCINEAIESILRFSDRESLGAYGYDKLTELYSDAFEWEVGIRWSEILDIYFVAYEMAMEQIEANGGDDNE